MILLQALREDLCKFTHLGVKAWREFRLQTTGADIAGHHTHTGDQLKDIQDHLTLAEAVQEHTHRPQVERAGTQPDQMAGDALQLNENHADIFDLVVDLVINTQQALHGQRVGQIVAERSQIVHAIG